METVRMEALKMGWWERASKRERKGEERKTVVEWIRRGEARVWRRLEVRRRFWMSCSKLEASREVKHL